MFKINNKNTRMTSTSFWCLYCYRWTNFISFYGVSIVDSEQVNLSWVWIYEINSFPDTSSVIKQKGGNLKTGVSRKQSMPNLPLIRTGAWIEHAQNNSPFCLITDGLLLWELSTFCWIFDQAKWILNVQKHENIER